MKKVEHVYLIVSPEPTKNDNIILKYYENNMNVILNKMFVIITHLGNKNIQTILKLGVTKTPTLIYRNRLIIGVQNIINIWNSNNLHADHKKHPKKQNLEDYDNMCLKELLKEDEDDGKMGDGGEGFDMNEVSSKLREYEKKMKVSDPTKKNTKSVKFKAPIKSESFDNMPENILYDTDDKENIPDYSNEDELNDYFLEQIK